MCQELILEMKEQFAQIYRHVSILLSGTRRAPFRNDHLREKTPNTPECLLARFHFSHPYAGSAIDGR
jgi:hypothetical protein